MKAVSMPPFSSTPRRAARSHLKMLVHNLTALELFVTEMQHYFPTRLLQQLDSLLLRVETDVLAYLGRVDTQVEGFCAAIRAWLRWSRP